MRLVCIAEPVTEARNAIDSAHLRSVRARLFSLRDCLSHTTMSYTGSSPDGSGGAAGARLGILNALSIYLIAVSGERPTLDDKKLSRLNRSPLLPRKQTASSCGARPGACRKAELVDASLRQTCLLGMFIGITLMLDKKSEGPVALIWYQRDLWH
jgi:hypothetical protein